MLISSISGIRGTVGEGSPPAGGDLTPEVIVSFVKAYGTWILQQNKKPTVVIGRDGRESGEKISDLVILTLRELGINVMDLGLATTPTIELSVTQNKAQGGVIISASHNPAEYNGFKLLNSQGEILSAKNGQEVQQIISDKTFAPLVDRLGDFKKSTDHLENHIRTILNLDLVDADLVKSKNYKVVVDGINSVGGIAIPVLLEKMGVEVVGLNLEISGQFAHVPEPLERNLSELKSAVTKYQADLGVAVDPDADRLSLVNEKGEMFGQEEEYVIVAVSDYILQNNPGPVVSNLSSSRALADLAQKYGVKYQAAAVGETNVASLMKEIGAVAGGEGNGGVIYPPLSYVRDSLVGVALFLTYLAKSDVTASELRERYSDYYMIKDKVVLEEGIDIDKILSEIEKEYQSEKITTIDGLKIDFPDSWVHLRKSNTEPIVRIYTEAKSPEKTKELSEKFISRFTNHI